MAVRVRGRVQGVSFRAWAREEALRRDLTGWARNRADGSVEILAEGDGSRLVEFVEALHVGPPAARVDEVESVEVDPTSAHGFAILATA